MSELGFFLIGGLLGALFGFIAAKRRGPRITPERVREVLSDAQSNLPDNPVQSFVERYGDGTSGNQVPQDAEAPSGAGGTDAQANSAIIGAAKAALLRGRR